jgi:hypothetical protein
MFSAAGTTGYGRRILAQDVGVLWRPPLGDVAPVSATLTADGRAELIYSGRREIRTWPSFELLDTKEGAESPRSAAAGGGLADRLSRPAGGSVSAVSAGPVGRVAALWTAERFPPCYRMLIWDQSGHVMTPDTVRIAGAPCWASSGELAVAAFDGIRRGIVLTDQEDGGVQR